MTSRRWWALILRSITFALVAGQDTPEDDACSPKKVDGSSVIVKPCQNDGECTPILTNPGYECACLAGFTGQQCEININDCVNPDQDCDIYGRMKTCEAEDETSEGLCPMCDSPCLNEGTCTDKVEGFECTCRHGYRGTLCETKDYYTLQQWDGAECTEDLPPFRCFRLMMDECIDTGMTDGVTGNQANWFGRLTESNGKYTIDLCWGETDDPDDKCKCENHFTKIPRQGRNSLGPKSKDVRDSDECHKLKGITSSRLVNSTGAMKGNKMTNITCGAMMMNSRAALVFAIFSSSLLLF